MTTYQAVTVDPYPLRHIDRMSLDKAPGQHTTLFLTGVLAEETQEEHIQELLEKKTVRALTADRVIFSGMVERVRIEARAGDYHITLAAVSHSKKLDLSPESHSYQDADLTLADLMSAVVRGYEGAAVMVKTAKGKKAGAFLLQYRETAWAFLKRMASVVRAPLIVEDVLDEPKIYCGLPEKKKIGDLTDFQYAARKETADYRETTQGYRKTAFESDFICYEIVSDQIFEIGNKVLFRGRTFYVYSARIRVTDGVFENVYLLKSKTGFRTNPVKNEGIAGLSLSGKVVDVERSSVRILLDIDRRRPDSSGHWFLYATPYTSVNGGGFYSMPEIGERARLYMPDAEERHAYVTGNIRRTGDSGQDSPDIKYWRTPDGKELRFTPDGVRITCRDGDVYLDLSDRGGIAIQSGKGVTLAAEGGAGIGMFAEGGIVLSANSEIDMFCNGSRINLKGGVTQIRGNAVNEE
jgi:phage baseplate assembly protein gpV